MSGELTTPNDDAQRVWPATVAALGALVVLLAGEPLVRDLPSFSAGYVLRRAALALVTALVLGSAALVTLQGASSPRPRWWAYLPAAAALLALLALPGITRGLELTLLAAGWFTLTALPIGLSILYRTPERTAATWRWLTLAAAVLVGFGLIERSGGGRMAASFGRPAIAGTVFGALLVPAFLLGFGRGVFPRVALTLVLAVGCAASGSRAAIVAAIVGALFATRLAGRSTRVRRAAGAAGVVIVAAVVLFAGFAAQGTLQVPGGGDTVEVRLGLHRASLALVQEKPLTGHGLGRYPSEALRARDVVEARLEPGRRPTHAHFDALHWGVEGGVFAGLALLLFLGAAIFTAHRAARDADHARRRALAAAVGVLITVSVAALGDGILVDPAPVLLASVAVAAVLATRAATAPSRVRGGACAGGAAAFLVVAVIGVVSAIADGSVQAHVNERAAIEQRAAALLLAPDDANRRLDASAQSRLERALALEPSHPEANYQRAIVHARLGERHRAETRFRAAFAADPGKTEARLDLAHLFRLQDRTDDARATLERATRHDPTRYDLWLRLGHVELGDEGVPGDPVPERDWTPVLKAYNEARALAPTRFENDVALARVERRRGHLARADELLKQSALRVVPRGETPGPEGPTRLMLFAPAEVVLEAFRVTEAMGAGDAVLNEFLKLALEKDRSLGVAMAREAERLIEEGERREAAARSAAAASLDPREFAAADRTFDAAALRLAALLQTRLADGPAQVVLARAEREERKFRSALARYRALLAWTAGAEKLAAKPEETRRRRMELLGEAASAATRVDAGLARTYYARQSLLRGLMALDGNDAERAIADLRRAIDRVPDEAAAHFALARAHTRLGEFGLGAEALVKAIELDARFAQAAQIHADVAPLLTRPEVREILR